MSFIHSYTGNSSFAEKDILFLPSFLSGFINLSSPIVKVIKIFILACFYFHKRLLSLSLLVVIGEVFGTFLLSQKALIQSSQSKSKSKSDKVDGVLNSDKKAVES
jgi:hypothetical protein